MEEESETTAVSSTPQGSHTLPRSRETVGSRSPERPRPASIHAGMRFAVVDQSDNGNNNHKHHLQLFPPLLWKNQKDGSSPAERGWHRELQRVPSQATGLATTVPQSLVPQRLAGRHVPTRNSLRHSRMIVLSRSGKDLAVIPRKYLPPVMRYHRLAKGLAAIQTLLGIAVTSMAVWLLLWTPSLRIRDVPHWSGIPLLLAGLLGLFLLCCCRKEYPGMKYNGCVFTVKILSVTMSVLAIVTSFCACAFAAIHLAFLSHMTCSPSAMDLGVPCTCRSSDDISGRVYRYEELTCLEVESLLKLFLIGSCAANGVAGCISAWYVFLHWVSRYMYIYSSVRGQDDSPIIVSPHRVR